MSAYQAKQSVRWMAPDGSANRAAGTLNGTSMTMQQVSGAMLAAGAMTGRSVTTLVAASDASTQVKAGADYVCDGTADEVEINAALAALGAIGGVVQLSEGQFNLAAKVILTAARQVLRGMGMGATVLRVINAGGAPVNDWMIRSDYDYCEIADLTIDGNKANNAAATGMMCLSVGAGQSPIVQRVRALNSAKWGFTVEASTRSAVVRDCLIEGSTDLGLTVRSTANHPAMVYGCTVKSGSSVGIVCDNGPVILSECYALSNAGVGFSIASGAAILTNCVAMNNAGVGFSVVAGTTRTMMTACRAINNATVGFFTAGTQTQYVGCIATGTPGGGRGFWSATSAVDISHQGCLASDNTGTGFLCQDGRNLYVGCRAINNTNVGFEAIGGEALIRHCFVYGPGASSNHGMTFGGGANHVVDGCRILNIGGYGIWTSDVPTGMQITNTFFSHVSLLTNNTYIHMTVNGDQAFIHGNMLRDPAAGNRPSWGIAIASTSDNCFVGHNDTSGAGVSTEVYDGSTTTRRPVKLQLDYVASTDLISTGVGGGTWTATPNQTFRVDSLRSYVEISYRGLINVGASTAGAMVSTRIVIDNGAIIRYLSGITLESTSFQNPLAGGAPIKLTGLSVGNHLVKLEIGITHAGTIFLRAATSPATEIFALQVTEYARL